MSVKSSLGGERTLPRENVVRSASGARIAVGVLTKDDLVLIEDLRKRMKRLTSSTPMADQVHRA
jgi:hypothetical protein